MENIIILSLATYSIILMFLVSYFYRALLRWKNACNETIKHYYDSQIDWLSYAKDKMKLMKAIGIYLPLEEQSLKHHEKVLIDGYAKIHDHIEDKTIQQKIND